MSSHWRSKKETKSQIALHAFRKLLFHQTSLPPSVFFVFILLQQLDLLSLPTRVNWLFFTGITFFILTLFNHYFYFSSALTTNLGLFTPINFFLGLLGCNQKWKFLLFCFTCSYYLPVPHTQLQDLAVIIFSAIICYLTYRSLIFATQRDNKSYFSGFFAFCCLRLCTYVFDFAFKSSFSLTQRIFIVPVLILLGYAVIKIRIENIMNLKIKEIKTPHTIILYIETLLQSFKNSQNINSYLLVHKQTCTNTQCYCQGYSEQALIQMDLDRSFPISKQIINNIFSQSFENNLWSLEDRYFMIHRYVEFLMDSKQYPRCINLLSHMQQTQMGYFSKCDNFVVKEKLKTQYEKEVYFDNLCNKIKYIYSYDLQLGYVNKQIREILKDKVEFWGELCKQSPILKKMEVNGRKLVQRIQDLHEYFMYKIRPCEEALSYFKCTFIYSSYLFMTTNYIQFANSLTKKAQKVIEEKKGSIGYGMQYGLFLKINENGDKVKQYLFQVDITNISTSLCGLLGRQKSSLLNQNVTELIPDEFKDIHCIAFDRYARYNNFHKGESALVGQSIDLPFKISNTQAIFLNLTTALRFDPINNSANIECVLKKVNSSTITFIMDLNGYLVYRETQAFKDLAYQPSIQNSIKKMKQQYMQTQLFEKIQFKSEQEQNMFGVTISPLFCNRLIERGMKPLLKVQITSDNLRNEKIRMFDCQPTKAKQPFQAAKSVQQNDSQASTSSRKDSIENVLTILMESSSIKIEPFLILTLLVLAVISIIYFVLINKSFNIWETSVMQDSPTFSVINLVNMKTIFNFVIGYRYDVVQNYTFPESQQIANSIFIGETIQHYTTSKYLQMLIVQRDIFNSYILGRNNAVILELADLLSEQIVVKSRGLQNTQTMSLQSVIINYLVGFHHLYQGADYMTLILSSSYLSSFYQKLTIITDGLVNGLKEDLETARKNNIIFCSFFSLLLALFIIPLWKFNVSNKKKHLKIYNLFACLEAKIIVQEIKKLERIENQVFMFSCKSNANESAQQVTSLFGITQQRQQTSTKANENENNHNPLQEEKQKIVSILENVKIRKRGGDIIVDGSDCDIKKIIVKDWVSTLFIFAFLIILTSFFWSKLNYISKVEQHFDLTLETMKSLETMTIGVLNSKIFFDDYNENNQIQFLGQDLENWMKKWIIDFQKVRMYELNKTTDTVTCTNNLVICERPFTVKLFISYLKKSISDAFQMKRTYRNNNSTEAKLNLEKARLSLTVAQQINGKIGQIYYNWFFQEFGNLTLVQKSTEVDRFQKSIVFWIFIGIFMVFSLVYTIYRKKQYVKEVTLLSILNKQMLYNNKSVESFIHRLSKSLR